MEKILILKYLLLLCALPSLSTAEEIDCTYGYIIPMGSSSDNLRICQMTSVFEEPVEATSVPSVSENFMENETNSDIEVFYVSNFLRRDHTKYYPTKLCTQFPNLKRFNLFSPAVVELKRETFEACEELNRIVYP